MQTAKGYFRSEKQKEFNIEYYDIKCAADKTIYRDEDYNLSYFTNSYIFN